MAEQSNNIEEFFKRFSETYPAKIEFNEAHWQRMEAMLDEELPVESSASAGYKPFSKARVGTIAGVILLVVGVAISWLPGKEAQLAEHHTTPVDGKEVPQNNARAAEQSFATSTVPEENLNDSEQNPPGKSVQPLYDGRDQEEFRMQPGSDDRDLEEQPVGRALSGGQGLSTEPRNPLGLPVNENQSHPDLGSRKLAEGPILHGLRPLGPDQLAPGHHVVSLVVIEEFPVKEQEAFPRIAVAVGVSPDLSSNQVGTYNRTGSAFGGIFEYRISRRWSLEVGVLSAKKKYAVDGEDYSPEDDFWEHTTQGQVPNTIDADCWVIDLPINVRYRAWQNESSTFSASVGLSSYLMMSEDYHYTLGYGADGWGSGHENDHFFGAANIQLHYEKRLGQWHAFEVAPFLKLPLTGYGHGDIKFHSTGVLLSFRRYLLWK